MDTDRTDSARHYWYGDGSDRSRSIAVLEALRSFRAAESAQRRRSQVSLGLGENDILAMRYLLRAHEQGRAVGPKELAQYLGITSASITVLLDRLEKADRIHRQSSPFDRRALIIVPTVPTDEIAIATLGEVREELVEVIEGLSAEDAELVIRFLAEMRDALDQIDNRAYVKEEHR
ncbi:MarR family winged helix-turn-helix transcriptional regulator [Herbiconiux sp. YIM B11900]|uniref:MarR family winged helix-turn-helix transcriptional regulator n=1 Tax=Herbiconiux sp. YIM B11900 TaxID=3404131 RepID=UPI003F85AD2A